ncbi:hypothetical protein [Burkholderia anthina]
MEIVGKIIIGTRERRYDSNALSCAGNARIPGDGPATGPSSILVEQG